MTPEAPSADAQDVTILGGGLAGLCLALQLRQRHPDLRIRVLERRQHPVPEAAFKIGESSVEIGAEYFGQVLGLQPHLDHDHIIKFGFRFFFSDQQNEIDRCVELGASQSLPTGSWQIDRGRFENFLAGRARSQGIDLRTAASVRSWRLGDDKQAHSVTWQEGDRTEQAETRWLVDASGRAGLLKRQLGLAADNGHRVNSVWFRVKGRIEIDTWSDCSEWQARCRPPERWRSTNHLVGDGYWVWLIPLASGSHSVGIVCDADKHPLERMRSFELAMAWLAERQPRLVRALEPMKEQVQDFGFLRHLSYGCKQVFSSQRWALTGEAGAFLDPFYSPGSDFIAIANTYICRLIEKDLAGEPWAPYAQVYEQLFFSFYDSTLAMYKGQYHLFGRPDVLPLKVLWDYSYYWGVLGPMFFARRLDDLPSLSRLREDLAGAKALNLSMQHKFAEWGHRAAAASGTAPSAFLDQASLPWFAELNRALRDPLNDSQFRARLRDNLQRLRDLAAEIEQSFNQRPRRTPPAASISPNGLLPPTWRT
ncbi:tryptophan 7-halogenase [Pseudoxanthomonas sp. CAU 1598]|uniref:Tryptophan 7-halogenase n=2 Tax=Pseudomarimonas arenosa TaxID=2774145 RepID=A0AAW3ZI03_9GAMM|nr:tryptophan 7-halogenase [Pseudomarimonas arenosa]